MSDASGQIRAGEKRPIYVTQTLPECVQGSVLAAPAPVVTLYDDTGAIAGGIDGALATGYTPFQSNSLQVWYRFDNAASPLAAGLYDLTFTYSVTVPPTGASQCVSSVELEVLAEPYMPLAARLCRRRLSETPEQLPDGELYPEIDLMVLEVYGQYPTLDLTSLTGNDIKFFNQGVGLLTAAKLRPGRPKRVATGEIDSIRTATQQFSFSNLDRARVKNIELVETVWAAEGRTALGKVGLIRAFNQANASAWSPLVLTGASSVKDNLKMYMIRYVEYVQLLVRFG